MPILELRGGGWSVRRRLETIRKLCNLKHRLANAREYPDNERDDRRHGVRCSDAQTDGGTNAELSCARDGARSDLLDGELGYAAAAQIFCKFE